VLEAIREEQEAPLLLADKSAVGQVAVAPTMMMITLADLVTGLTNVSTQAGVQVIRVMVLAMVLAKPMVTATWSL
jgi:hypothetical protein